MKAGQVVLYFDKQEDAVQFALAASSVLSADEPVRSGDALTKIAEEICKASRIRTEGSIQMTSASDQKISHQPGKQCA